MQKMVRRAASLVALASLLYALLHLRGGQESDEANEAKAKVVDTNGSLSLVNRALIKT